MSMDHTPVYFLMSPKNMLSVKGVKTVHICTSTNDTKHAMVAVTICADGMVLQSVVVFKGQLLGRIATKEFVTLVPIISIIIRQQHGWSRG